MSAPAPLIIECRCNEFAKRLESPHVPYSPEEIVEAGVGAWEEGASILHWHAREPETGKVRHDVELYAAVYRALGERTDLILHPTLGASGNQDPEERTRHVRVEIDGTRLQADLVPLDFGSVNVDAWDTVAAAFVSTDRVYLNPRENLETMLRRFRELGVQVVACCWSVGMLRTARRYQELGLLSEQTFWQFMFSGPGLPDAMAPTRNGLLAMVEQVPAGQQWSVLCYGGSVLELASWAIELGGHVSIGLGDWAYTELGAPTNAELVRHVRKLAEAAGREVASPARARELLGVPTHVAQQAP